MQRGAERYEEKTLWIVGSFKKCATFATANENKVFF